MRGEFERIRQQILEHLLQALGVGRDRTGKIGIGIDLERKLARLGFVTERPRHHVEQIGDVDVLGVDRDGAGLDLGQVENVADQIEQVGAGAVNGTGEFDLLAAEIAFRIIGELLAENEDRIERRAQLV